MIECKEHVVHLLLQGKVRLGQYDHRFLTNLQSIIHQNSRITTNQASLVDKLIAKYAKQLAKEKLTYATLIVLPWHAQVVESLPEYTGAVVSIVEDEITIRVPFNKKFIGAFSEVDNNSFHWNKDDKLYRSPFTTSAFKLATTILHRYFPTVQYCDNSIKILKQLEIYDAEVWNPTLKRMGDTYVIGACTTALYDVISDIELNLDPHTLYALSKMGIATDPKLIEHNPVLKIAAEYSPEVELENIEDVIKTIKYLGCGAVYLGHGFVSNAAEAFLRNNNVLVLSTWMGPKIAVEKNIQDIMVLNHSIGHRVNQYQYQMNNITKQVIIKDSRSIEVR